MQLYSVTVVRIVIEVGKRSKSVYICLTFDGHSIYCRIAALPSYFLRDIVLVYICFMSDGHSVDLSFTFIARGKYLNSLNFDRYEDIN